MRSEPKIQNFKSDISLLDRIDAFDYKCNDIIEYAERLEQYFNETDCGSEQSSIFLSIIGEEMYELLRKLLLADEPASKTMRKLREEVKKHLKPKPYVMTFRHDFYSRDQKDGETVSEYIEILRELCSSCDFKLHYDDALLDRFVCGLNNANIKKKLLSERELSLKRALRLAKKIEYEDVERKNERNKRATSELCDIHEKEPFVPSQCFRCHSKLHKSDDCRFKSITCHKCNMLGHLSKVCREDPYEIYKEVKKNHISKHREKIMASFEKIKNKNKISLNKNEETIVGEKKNGLKEKKRETDLQTNSDRSETEIDSSHDTNSIKENSDFDGTKIDLSLSPNKTKINLYQGSEIIKDNLDLGGTKIDLNLPPSKTKMNSYQGSETFKENSDLGGTKIDLSLSPNKTKINLYQGSETIKDNLDLGGTKIDLSLSPNKTKINLYQGSETIKDNLDLGGTKTNLSPSPNKTEFDLNQDIKSIKENSDKGSGKTNLISTKESKENEKKCKKKELKIERIRQYYSLKNEENELNSSISLCQSKVQDDSMIELQSYLSSSGNSNRTLHSDTLIEKEEEDELSTHIDDAYTENITESYDSIFMYEELDDDNVADDLTSECNDESDTLALDYSFDCIETDSAHSVEYHSDCTNTTNVELNDELSSRHAFLEPSSPDGMRYHSDTGSAYIPETTRECLVYTSQIYMENTLTEEELGFGKYSSFKKDVSKRAESAKITSLRDEVKSNEKTKNEKIGKESREDSKKIKKDKKDDNVLNKEHYTESDYEEDVYYVREQSENKNMNVLMKVENKEMNFRIDTGTGVSLISENTYKTHLSHLKLNNTNAVLKNYTEEELNVKGKIYVSLTHNGHTYSKLKLFVVTGISQSLLGRDWLSKIRLDWKSLFAEYLDKDNVKSQHQFK